jgi:hypothetical protein
MRRRFQVYPYFWRIVLRFLRPFRSVRTAAALMTAIAAMTTEKTAKTSLEKMISSIYLSSFFVLIGTDISIVDHVRYI